MRESSRESRRRRIIFTLKYEIIDLNWILISRLMWACDCYAGSRRSAVLGIPCLLFIARELHLDSWWMSVYATAYWRSQKIKAIHARECDNGAKLGWSQLHNRDKTWNVKARKSETTERTVARETTNEIRYLTWLTFMQIVVSFWWLLHSITDPVINLDDLRTLRYGRKY